MTRRARATFSAALGLAAVFIAPASDRATERAAATRPSVRPAYTRPKADRPSTDRPQPRTVPEDLQIPEEPSPPPEIRAAGAAAPENPEARSGVTPARPPAASSSHDSILIDDAFRRGAAAGTWTARELARTTGSLEYYRAGAWNGLHAALDDEDLGRWDFFEGLRLGALDPMARMAGSEDGRRLAEDNARTAAEGRVAAEFSDLSREPRFDPRVATTPYRDDREWAALPELREVFDLYPPNRFPSPRLVEAFRSWRFDPWGFYQCRSHAEVFDRAWSDRERAFRYWSSDRNRALEYQLLPEDDARKRFRANFGTSFDVEIARQYEGRLAVAWEEGFEDGWDWGAAIAWEWNFRRGYREGFETAARVAAQGAYLATYPRAFEAGYRESFDSWSTSLHAEILGVRVADGNDDGISEPGERLALECDVANLGGGTGTLRLQVEGRDLVEPEGSDVHFASRGRLPLPATVIVQLRADAALASKSLLDLELGATRRSVEVRVSRPVGFEGAPRTRVRALEGSASIELTVLNRSRRPVTTVVVLDTAAARLHGETRDLGVLAPDERRPLTFELDGLHPLDLFEGSVDYAVSVLREGERLETLNAQLPGSVDDPSERTLLAYLVDLAREATPSPDHWPRARALVVRKVRAEWGIVAEGAGNPFRDDLRDSGQRTVLGALVAIWKNEQKGLRQLDLFRRLGEDLESEVENLPGVHPRLRSAARDLARRIG